MPNKCCRTTHRHRFWCQLHAQSISGDVFLKKKDWLKIANSQRLLAFLWVYRGLTSPWKIEPRGFSFLSVKNKCFFGNDFHDERVTLFWIISKLFIDIQEMRGEREPFVSLKNNPGSFEIHFNSWKLEIWTECCHFSHISQTLNMLSSHLRIILLLSVMVVCVIICFWFYLSDWNIWNWYSSDTHLIITSTVLCSRQMLRTTLKRRTSAPTIVFFNFNDDDQSHYAESTKLTIYPYGFISKFTDEPESFWPKFRGQQGTEGLSNVVCV